MSSSSSSSSKQDLKVENTSEINKEEEKKPITTPKQESLPQEILSENTTPFCPNLESPPQKILSENTTPVCPNFESPLQKILSENTTSVCPNLKSSPQEILSENTIPVCPNLESLSQKNLSENTTSVCPNLESPPHKIFSENTTAVCPNLESPPQEILSENTTPVSLNLEIPTAKTEKDTIQKADPPKDDDKLFICMSCKKKFPTPDIHKKDDPEEVLEQKLLKSIILLNSLEAGSSSSSRNSPFPSFNGGSSSSNNTAFPTLINRGVITEMKTTIYQGLYSSGPNYGGGGSSSTNSKPLFASGVTRGVSSMFSSPPPNRFFTGSRSYRTYRPTPIDYGIFSGGSNKNKKSVGSWVSGEVPREMIDLNKPPCVFVDLIGDDDDDDDDDEGKAKRDLEGDVKGLGTISWGIKKRRTR